MKWDGLFFDGTLEMGKKYFRDGVVQNLTRTDGRFGADLVFKTKVQSVELSMNDGQITDVVCSCGKSRCAHVAAFMYQLESDFPELLGEYPEPFFLINHHSEGDGSTTQRLCKYFGSDEVVCVPDGVSSIGDRVFENHKEIKKIILPKSVSKIGYYAFNNCNNLEDINIDSSVEIKELQTFDNCYKLANSQGFIIVNDCLYRNDSLKCNDLVIPNGVKRIGREAFLDNYFESIVIPESVEYIDYGAFGESHNLKEIVIPDNLKEIDMHVFADCESLESVILPNGIKEIFASFINCKKLKNINLPDSIDKLDNAFYGCESIEKVKLPKPGINSESRYSYAFEGCVSLTEAYIPAEVLRMDGTFADCINLERVTFDGDKITLSDDVFKGCDKLQIVCSKKLEKCLPDEYKKMVFKDEERKKADAISKAEEEKEAQRIAISSGGIRLYEQIDNYDVESMLMDIDEELNVGNLIYPDSKRIKVDVDGNQYKVSCRIGNDLASHSFFVGHECVDIVAGSTDMMGTEEAQDFVQHYDSTSDHYMHVYALVSPNICALSDAIANRRKAFLVAIGHILSRDEIITNIVEKFPKKKDGTFNKAKIMRLASDGMIYREKNGLPGAPGLYNELYEIYAKAKDDTSLTISANFRPLTPTECECIFNDYIAHHCEELGINKYLQGK